MAIETICQHCARKLRVDDEFAGRKARCPHCKTVYTVPDQVREKEPRYTNPAAPSDQWRLRTEDGNVYGPVSKAEVDIWLTEGRITAGSYLQRDGHVEWLPATSVYPALAKSAVKPISSSANPFADGEPSVGSNPYSTPRTVSPAMRQAHHSSHRGGTIVAFGILGIVCCFIFAPIAWAMGQADLQAIRSGRMDPSGRALTQAGMVLGIIGTVILAVQVIFAAIGIVAG